MKKLQDYNQKIRSSKKMPEFQAGDIVKIHRKIKEGGKERTQVFEGIIISIKGKQSSSPMITVRKVSFGVGVEITVPLFSPVVEKIEIVKKVRTKRAKLYYLRRKSFKLSKLKTKKLDQFVAEEPVQEIIEEPSDEKGEAAKEKKAREKEENKRDEEKKVPEEKKI